MVCSLSVGLLVTRRFCESNKGAIAGSFSGRSSTDTSRDGVRLDRVLVLSEKTGSSPD